MPPTANESASGLPRPPFGGDPGNGGGAAPDFRQLIEGDAPEVVQARLAAIVESSDDAIISKTLEGVIRSWNDGAERLFGFTAAEAIGRSITLIIPPERLDEEREILARIARGERVDHFETIRVTKRGRRVEISLTVSPVRDGTGRVVGASKIARDVSDRKSVEAALREADARKDRFIALLAHELRNPLAPLRNGLQLMRMAGDDAKAVGRAREMMERQLGHMVRLIDDLLDVSRISQNKFELRRARIALGDVVRSAVEATRPLIEAAGHWLTVSLPDEPVLLDADLTRLAQVFSNLLANSAKYTERGGRISLAADRRGEEVTVTVRDDGIGIPAEALPRIFDMFSQVDRSLERSTGGLGIGLALVKGLVEMHEGSVCAHSEGLGKGTIVTVTLPALATATATAAKAPAEELRSSPGPRRRILIVDDNRDAAESLKSIFRLLGDETRIARNGVEAVTEAEAFRPQLILMDLGMPGMNGYDATKQIRATSRGREAIIIALTGWGQEKDRALSREAGCDGHLVKPVNLVDLEKLLAALEGERSPSVQ
jgi:PAS domain S-box-containing protein